MVERKIDCKKTRGMFQIMHEANSLEERLSDPHKATCLRSSQIIL